MPNSSRARGIVMMLLASLSFAVMGALVKVSTRGLPFFSVVFARSAVIAAVSYGVVRARRAPLRARNRRLMLWRSGTGFVAMCCYFFALSAIPLATAVTIQFTAPLFVALLSGVVLGERVSPVSWALILAAFVGVALVLSPELASLNLAALAALLAAILAAFAYLAVRGLRTTDLPETIVLQFSIFSLVASAPALLLLTRWPTPEEALVLLGVGLCASGGQLGMTHAFRHGDAAFVSAFSYSAVLFGAVLGVIGFGEHITAQTGVGALLVVSAGAALSLVEGPP